MVLKQKCKELGRFYKLLHSVEPPYNFNLLLTKIIKYKTKSKKNTHLSDNILPQKDSNQQKKAQNNL